jgi:hypothetical protein
MDYKVKNTTIRFMGYDKYLRLKEMVRGVNQNFETMSKVILVGKSGDECTKVTLDLLNATCKKEKVPFQELYNGQPIADNFWRIGEVMDAPNVFIKKL